MFVLFLDVSMPLGALRTDVFFRLFRLFFFDVSTPHGALCPYKRFFHVFFLDDSDLYVLIWPPPTNLLSPRPKIFHPPPI